MSESSGTPTDSLSLNHKEGKLTAAQIQEFNEVRESLRIARDKYNSCKILHEAVEDSLSDPSLDPELKRKVQDVTLGHGCAQVVELESESYGESPNTVLGVVDLTNSVLSHDESLKVTKAVVASLDSKYEDICETFLKTFGENVDRSPAPSSVDFGGLSLSVFDPELFELKSKLLEIETQYIRKLVEEHRLLENIVNVRLEQLPKVCETKVIEYQAKSQLASAQAKIIQERTRVDIFAGTTNSLLAYEELMNDVKSQHEKCQRDIQYLEELKQQYRRVACKEYDDVLNSFIEITEALEKKKMICDSLNV